jgi:hypothetical protein
MNDRTLTDTQITAAFIARSEGSVSQDLAERIRAETSRTRQASRLVVLTGGLSDNANAHRLLWAAAISATSLALVGGLFFAGRQPDEQTSVVPPPSPSQPVASPPTPSADPSTSPLPSPATEPTPAVTNPPVDPTLDLESFAVTLVDQLRVRSQPTVAESSAKLEPLLPVGVRLFVIEESVAADGYAWYHVLPVDPGYPSGWVAAASRDGEPWIDAAPAECPSLPIEPLEMDSLGVYGGLACFGDNEIQLMGEVSCQAADVDLTIGGPSWLRSDQFCTFSGGDGTRQIQDGGAGLPGPGALNGIVTGHFADPQSSSCVWAIDPPAPDAAEITTTCRAMFVATDWKSVPID